MLGDRLAHRLARLRVLERVVGRALRDPERLRGDARARAVEDPHRDLEALALLAEQVRGGDAAVVEGELAGGRAGDAHLRLQASDGEARRIRLDEERGDPRMPAVGVGLREDGVEVGDAGVGDEALAAVEDVLVAVADGRRPHRRRVGAGAGLRQRVRGQPLAAREPRQVRLLLRLRAGELEPERAELLHGEQEAARRADLRDLLDRDEREQRARARAAVLLVEEQAEDLVLAEELDDVPGELVRLVDLGRARRHALPREGAHELADLALLVGEDVPGHGRQSSRRSCRRTATCRRSCRRIRPRTGRRRTSSTSA